MKAVVDSGRVFSFQGAVVNALFVNVVLPKTTRNNLSDNF